MKANKATGSNSHYLRLYLFSSALTVNLLLGIMMTANWLSIRYFFHAMPMIILIDFLSAFESVLLWIGSLYLVYATKEIAEQAMKLRRVNWPLNLAVAGSFFLLFSISVDKMSLPTELASNTLVLQLLPLATAIGYILSFGGSFIALFAILNLEKSILSLFPIYLVSVLIPIEIWSLFHWFAYPFDIISYSGFAWQGAFTELQIFYLVYPLVFLLLIAFLFSWIWVPLVKCVKGRITRMRKFSFSCMLSSYETVIRLQNEFTFKKPRDRNVSQESSTVQLVPVALLLFSLLLGAFVAYYPYINPDSGLVGWDTPGYHLQLTRMVGKDLCGAVQFVTTTDKPLYFLIVYSLKTLTQLSSYTIVQLMPIITILANSLAVFWFVKIGEGKALAASLAALFTIFSFNTTIAMHAGTFANWLAMAVGFVAFGLVLKYQEIRSPALFIETIIAWASVFFIHYWSGVVFLLILGFYLLVNLIEPKRRAAKLAVYAFLASSVAILLFFFSDLSLSIFPSYGAAGNVGPGQAFSLFMAKLPALVDLWFLGSLANPVMLVLALVGIFACYRNKTSFSRLMISWVFVVSVISLFVSPVGRNMDQWLLWRTLYLLPFHIPAAIGLSWIVTRFGRPKTEETAIDAAHDQWRSRKLFDRLCRNRRFADILFLAIVYMTSALLLNLNFPLALVLLGFNYVALTLVFHNRFRKRDPKSIVMLLFVLLVTLMLLNYTLRSLAPLATNRMPI